MNYNYDTSYTSYGTGGGAGGGGFIPGEASQNSPSGGRREFQQDSLRPVTIKQIHGCESALDDTFKIDGAVINQVTFVAQIRNISSQTTNITYKLDDGTGSIEVKVWVDSENPDPPSGKGKLVESEYCRVWGKLKSFNNKLTVSAHIVRPVEDKNEISYHLLEATAVHLYFTRGPLGGATAGPAATNGDTGYAQQNAGGGGGYGGVDMSQYSATARKVYEYLRQTPQSNEGLHQQDIAANLKLNIGDVASAGDDLLTGGLIYTTVDDQTWAILEAD